MGVIQVPGQVSGKSYAVQIDGDVPTNSEYARIADYVRQEEERFIPAMLRLSAKS